MIDTLQKILALFTPKERRQLAGVLFAIMMTGLLQVAGVGSVVPFLSLLTDPSFIHSSAPIASIYQGLGFDSDQSFIIFFGFIVLFLLIAGNAFIAFTLWVIARFSWSNQRRLSVRLMTRYLAQPYETLMNRNTADTGKNILLESQQFTQGVLIQVLNLLAFGVTVAMMVILLLVLNPLLATATGVVFGGIYLLAYMLMRRPLLRLGQKRIAANTERFKAVEEAFGGFKEVKVLGLERSFISRYEPSAGTFATSMAALQVMSGLPRYVIETLAFGTVMALFLYLLASEGGVQAVLPTIGAFALAGYRLLPALQQVYISSTTLRFNQSVLDTMHRDLMASARPEGESHRDTPSTDITLPVRPAARLPFRRELRLDQVTYTYPGAEVPALREVSLVIPRKSSVAFIGATGSGKSTLVDIILGLLQPQSGSILVDGTEINENNLSAWQANIGYVPQDIYLTDDTITANIAFGVPHDQIDYKALERAARIANIHDFISAELPDKYETVVGERGIRMSGGQKQRIGIARALYHDPAVLVLDEATSSLDSETERCIVESLEEVRGDRTLIVITHRLSTVRRSDRLYQVVRGCLTEA